MSIIFVLIPLGLLLLAIAVGAFIWAVNNDQFDDLDRAGESILFDDDEGRAGSSPAGGSPPADGSSPADGSPPGSRRGPEGRDEDESI